MRTIKAEFSRAGIKFCLLTGLFCLLAVPALAQVPETNGYTADKPLALYSHETIRGGLYYTAGSSYYSEKLYPGEVYTVSHSVSLPEAAVVKFARLYNYWTWSAEGISGRDPEMKLSFEGVELEPAQEYSDRKGWGIYDYPTGTWAYDVSAYLNGSGTYSTSVENSGPGTSYFCINGMGLLIVYTDPNGKDIEYWISEGADELDSQLNEKGKPLYYTTPNQTICEMLRPTLQLPVRSATLWTITQSGNWEDNTLWINDAPIPGICDGKPYPDLELDVRDITDCLIQGENAIRFQAVGDYVVPSGAFLTIENTSGEKEVSAHPKEISEKTRETGKDSGAFGTEAKKSPGFGFGFTLLFLTSGILISGRRSRGLRK